MNSLLLLFFKHLPALFAGLFMRQKRLGGPDREAARQGLREDMEYAKRTKDTSRLEERLSGHSDDRY